MAYWNVINEGYLFNDTTVSGARLLTASELSSLCDGISESGGITLSGTEVVGLTVDFGAPYKLNEVRVYTDCPTLSGIEVSYSMDGENYYDLTLSSGSGYYYKTLSGNETTARYFDFLFTTSGTEMNIYKLVIQQDDGYVDFGRDGSQTSMTLPDRYSAAEPLHIFNDNEPGSLPVNARVMVDFTEDREADGMIRIALSSDGPFYGIEDGIRQPGDYSWANGKFNDVELYDDMLGLKVIVPGIEDELVYLSDTPYVSMNGSATFDDERLCIWVTHSPTNLWKYSITAGSWAIQTGLPGDITWKDSIVYANNKLYILKDASSNNFWVFDINEDIWDTTGLSDGPQLNDYVKGGVWDGNDTIWFFLTGTGQVWVPYSYTISTDTWSGAKSSSPNYSNDYSSSYHQGSFQMDRSSGKVYVYAGQDADKIFVYDTIGDSWSTIPLDGSGNCPRKLMAFLNGKLYYTNNGSDFGKLYVYDLSTNERTQVAVYSSGGLGYLNNFAWGYDEAVYFMTACSNKVFFVYGSHPGVYKQTGTYTTPVFDLWGLPEEGQVNNSTRIFWDSQEENNTSITKTVDSSLSTIEVRGSDTVPIDRLVFWVVKSDISSQLGAALMSNFGDELYVTNDYGVDYAWTHKYPRIEVAPGGKAWVTVRRWYGNYSYSHIAHLSETENVCSVYLGQSKYQGLAWKIAIGVTSTGQCWVVSTQAETPGSPDTVVKLLETDCDPIVDIVDPTKYDDVPVHGLAVDSNDGCYIADRTSGCIRHLTVDGTNDITWAMAATDFKSLAVDNNDEVWYATSNMLYHVNGNGAVDVTMPGISSPDKMLVDSVGNVIICDTGNSRIIKVNPSGEMVSSVTVVSPMGLGADLDWNVYTISTSQDKIYRINWDAGIAVEVISNIWGNIIEPEYVSFTVYHEKYTAGNLPIEWDPVWGAGGTLNWEEYGNKSISLPQTRFVQARFTLRGPSTNQNHTPYLKEIVIPPGLLLEQIPPQQYGTIYVDTEIPAGTDVSQKTGRIKVFWLQT